MKTTLYIVVDVSGSMNEMGKNHLLRNLCRHAAQLHVFNPDKYKDIEFRFYHWAESVSEIVVHNDEDVPSFTARGSSSLSVLAEFVLTELQNAQSLRVLVMSDGNFSNSDIFSFQQQLNSCQNVFSQVVAVGADADLLKLKKISSNRSVFLSENISSAIDCTLFGTEKPEAVPESTLQILQTGPVSPEEGRDA